MTAARFKDPFHNFRLAASEAIRRARKATARKDFPVAALALREAHEQTLHARCCLAEQFPTRYSEANR